MFEEIIKFTGKEKGPASIILAGVHGDEMCGVEALHNLLPRFEIDRGIVLCGYGNPRAIELRKRYVEANLNRMFRADEQLTALEKKSYEYQRAQFLKPYLHSAEALLDIHASSIPKSRSFAICEANAQTIVLYLPIDLVVSGFDAVEPGGTDYYMNHIGKIGICIECGYTKDPQSVMVAEESIRAFLQARGHVKNNFIPRTQVYVRMFKKYCAQTNNFILSKPFENFEQVGANQLIGTDGQEKICAPKNSFILFAHNGTQVNDEVFLLGEKIEGLV